MKRSQKVLIAMDAGEGRCVSTETVAATLLACIASLVIAYKLWSHNNKKRGELVPAGSLGLPVVGESLSFLSDLFKCRHEFVRGRVAKYGGVFKTHLFGHPTVIAPGPAGNRFVFSNESKLLEMSWPPSVQSVLGPNSLAVKTGNHVRRIRHALMTFLGPDTLQKFVPTTDLSIQTFLHQHFHAHTELKTYPLMKRLAFLLACRLLLSRDDEHELRKLEQPFMDFTRGMLQLHINFPGTPFYKAMKAAQFLRDVFDEWIQQRRMELESGRVAASEHDLLSCLLKFRDEEGQPLTQDEMKDNILLLLFAGHDTSAVTMTMLFKYLAENPDCYNQVLEEQEEIARGKCEGEGLNWNDLKRMRVSWRTVQETLRIQSPVHGGYRLVIQDFQYEGYKIPKGWKMHWNANATHRNSEWFPEPEKFKPCRFEGNGPPPYTFVPFGGGQRICPGYEFARLKILVLLHHIVRMFQWKLVDPEEVIAADPFPRAIRGLPIKIERRSY